VSCDSLYEAPSISWDMETVSKMDPTITMGSTQAQDSKAKPASEVRAAQSNQSEGRSDTKYGQQLLHPKPHRGDPAFSTFISESRLGGFLHAPPCGLALSRPGFYARDYLGKTHETTWSRFDQGWGGYWPLFGPMERHSPWLSITREW
jgi:hypothetical protein